LDNAGIAVTSQGTGAGYCILWCFVMIDDSRKGEDGQQFKHGGRAGTPRFAS